MQINYAEDFNNKLLCQEKIDEEEFLAICNGIVKNYRKNQNKINGKKIDDDKEDELFIKVMKSLPKYAKYFGKSSYEESLSQYLKSIPIEISISEKEYSKLLSQLMEEAIKLQTRVGEFSHNSGVNIDNDKTNYTNSVVDFEMASNKFTPEFIEKMAVKNGNVDEEIVKIYKDRAKSICSKMAEEAINDKTTYYSRLADYLVGFYADNEIARNMENDRSEIQ